LICLAFFGPREALLDPRSVAVGKVPTGMTCQVHEFDAREGGSCASRIAMHVLAIPEPSTMFGRPAGLLSLQGSSRAPSATSFLSALLRRSSAMIAPVSNVIAAPVTLASWRTIPSPHRGVALPRASGDLSTQMTR
jgi:hypothetical protein